jgi:4,5-dihydroxyphthalate decarboxylase
LAFNPKVEKPSVLLFLKAEPGGFSSRASAAKDAGKVSAQQSMLQAGVPIEKGPEGVDESDLLDSGEVDACLHAAEPRAFTKRRPNIVRLFPDSRTTEQAYFKKTAIFPIMHAVAIKKSFAQKNPDIVPLVFKAYSQSKQKVYDYLTHLSYIMDILPWASQEFEATKELMGENYFSYGIEPNRKTLESLFRYSYEQGLSSKHLKIEDLFLSESLGFAEQHS